MSLQSAVIAARTRPSVTIPVNPPAYDPQANGTIEKGVQDVNTQERKTKLALEARIGAAIPADHPVMEWGLEHSAFTLCRCAVGQMARLLGKGSRAPDGAAESSSSASR